MILVTTRVGVFWYPALVENLMAMMAVTIRHLHPGIGKTMMMRRGEMGIGLWTRPRITSGSSIGVKLFQIHIYYIPFQFIVFLDICPTDAKAQPH
jgi:hypothetical protein